MNRLKKQLAFCIVLFITIGYLGGLPLWSEGTSGGTSPTLIESEIYFTLLHTNDEHSQLIPHSSAVDYHPTLANTAIGGFPRLATAIKQIREEKAALGEEVLLVSGGDFIGGTAFSWLIPRGHGAELTIMQKLGYNVTTIGNHEYDYGTEVLTNYLTAAGYPEAHTTTAVLATNIQVDPNHPMMKNDLYREYHIVEMGNGLKVGFFGFIGEEAITVSADTKPFTFKDQKETARKAVADLKAQGVDLVMAVSHSGLEEDKVLAKEVEGIDVIIGGHSHTELHQPIWVEETMILQAGAYLKYLGRVDLAYNPQTGKLRYRNQELDQPFLMLMDSSIPSDPEIVELIAGYTEELNQLISYFTDGKFNDMMDIVVKSDFTLETLALQESPFGNFVTDAMRLITTEKTGKRVDVAIQANGSIRGSLIPGSMDYSKGQIAFYDLSALISLGYGSDGFAGYPITSFYLTGDEIRRSLEVANLISELMGDIYFLQFSGLRYDFNPSDVVLLNVPVKDIPVPSVRSVKKAELYTGEGIQSFDGENYVPLKRGDSTLYHVVADSYILSFLPMAGELLPQLEIVPKDQDGNPIAFEDFHTLELYDGDKQLKVWQTVVEYAASLEAGQDGIPVIPEYYRDVAGRINPVKRVPLLVWMIGILVITIMIFVFLVKGILRNRRRRRRYLFR